MSKISTFCTYVALCTFLVSCSTIPAPPSSTPIPASVETTPIQEERIIYGAFQAEADLYKPLIEKYNREIGSPQVTLVIFDTLPDYPTNVTDFSEFTRFMMSNADVTSHYFLTQRDIEANYLYNLKPFIDRDQSFHPEDFSASILNTFAKQDQRFIVPHTVVEPVLYYNKELWQELNIPLPPADWSWEDFIEILQLLAGTTKSGDQTYGYHSPFNPLPIFSGGIMASNALRAGLLNDTIQLDSPEVAALLEQVAELTESEAVILPNTPAGGGFYMEHTGLWLSTGGGKNGFNTPDMKPIPIGVLPAPVGGSFERQVKGYTISAATRNPAAAWKLISFLSQQPLYYNPNFLEIPARTSIAEQLRFWDTLDSETNAALHEMLGRPYQPVDFKIILAARQLSFALNSVRNGAELFPSLRAAQEEYATGLPIMNGPPPPLGTLPTVDVNPQIKETINYANILGDTGFVQEQAALFERQHPGIRINLMSSVPSRQIADLAQGFDCFPSFVPPDPAETSLLYDLNRLIEADPTFQRGVYDPNALNVLTDQGQLTGLPLEVGYRFFVVNTELAERLGLVEQFDSINSYEQLRSIVQVARDTGQQEDVYPLVSTNLLVDVLMLLELQDIPTLDTGTGVAVPRLADDSVIAATDDIMQLLTGPSAQPVADLVSLEIQARRLFLDGKALLLITDQWNDLGSMPMATQVFAFVGPLQATPVNAVRVFSLHIAAQSEHAETCWQWMTFLAAAAEGTIVGYPARQSDTQTHDQNQQRIWDVYHQIENPPSQHQSLVATASESTGLRQALLKIIQGQQAAPVLVEAQHQTLSYYACLNDNKSLAECRSLFQ